jgi:hypothetical protein
VLQACPASGAVLDSFHSKTIQVVSPLRVHHLIAFLLDLKARAREFFELWEVLRLRRLPFEQGAEEVYLALELKFGGYDLANGLASTQQKRDCR